MNVYRFILLFLIFGQMVSAQENIQQTVKYQVDSILEKLELEKDQTSKLELLISIHSQRIQGYPTVYLETALKLNKLSQRLKDPVMEANSWSFYGQGYRLMGNYIKALECHHKAIALAENTGNRTILAIAQNELAHIYKDREENEKAQRLYYAAMDNALKGQVPHIKTWPMMNLGAIYLAMNEPDSSLFYSQLALDNFHSRGATSNDAYILMNIAGAYSLKNENSKASAFYIRALEEAAKVGSNRFTNLVCVSISEHFLRLKQPDSSAYYAKKAIAGVQHTEFTFLSIKPAKLLTEIYESTNADSTLKYLRIYRAANDSLFSARAEQQLQMMTFEEDRRQMDLATEKINYRNKIKMNMMMGGLGTFLLIALILFRNNKQKQKANALLHHQKKEIENTLSQLKTTQAQLVQSEKMASLGELTAGIAHEIQNPLNFINNFSEVNAELIDEMKDELTTGNWQQAIEIATNIKDNEEKIAHHGKRADAIVKGMLQHSRSSSGVKEPTDINALADEYLRLAYHGLRAKDKTFNATIKTDFDQTIGEINIIPQDIGRVILNLITNAFYAVNDKKHILTNSTTSTHSTNLTNSNNLTNSTNSTNSTDPPSTYEPTVSVTTKKTGDSVSISVRDNGPGIPQHVIDKIFQPFFTTKPTGQGTGLGLSLSYDIIKAHGGQLTVDTNENEYTEFIIKLPVLAGS